MKEKAIFTAILGLALFALFIRIPRNDYGLPNHYVPDEPRKLVNANNFADALTNYSLQPPFMLYAYKGALIIADPFYKYIKNVKGYEKRFSNKHGYDLWVGRCLMAFFGALAVFSLFYLARYFVSAKSAFLASSLFAFSPIAISCTHYIKEDSPLTLFTVFSLWASASYFRSGRIRDLILMGIFSSLTFSAKFPGGVLILVALGIVLQRLWPQIVSENHWKGRLRLFYRDFRWFLMSFILGIIVFFSPWLIKRMTLLYWGITSQWKYLLSGHHDALSISFLDYYGTFYFVKALLPTIGLCALIVSIAGILWLRKSDDSFGRNPFLVPLLFSLLYWLALELIPAKPYPFFARYLLPAIPVFCILVSGGVEYLVERYPFPRGKHLAFILLFLFVAGVPFFQSVQAIKNSYPDTRDLVTQDIRDYVPQGAIVVMARYTGQIPQDGYKVLSTKPEVLTESLKEVAAREMYVIVSSFYYKRFIEHPDQIVERSILYHTIFETGHLIKEFSRKHVFFGFHNPVIRIYKTNTKEFREALEKYGRLATTRSRST